MPFILFSAAKGIVIDAPPPQPVVPAVPRCGMDQSGGETVGIRAIERAMNVLQELNLQPINTIAQLHARTKLPKPTLVRILRTLEEAGYVENDTRQGGYQVSALVTSLSSGFHKGPLVVEAGRAWAIAITRKHKWPVAIALPDYDGMIIRFITVPDSLISPFHSTVNRRLSMLTRGMGLAY